MARTILARAKIRTREAILATWETIAKVVAKATQEKITINRPLHCRGIGHVKLQSGKENPDWRDNQPVFCMDAVVLAAQQHKWWQQGIRRKQIKAAINWQLCSICISQLEQVTHAKELWNNNNNQPAFCECPVLADWHNQTVICDNRKLRLRKAAINLAFLRSMVLGSIVDHSQTAKLRKEMI